jgi:periplasmic divalent cation tolerance protein
MYFVYCPFPNMKEAQSAGKSLVEGGLCCCVNVVKSYSSIYKWQGKVMDETEFLLIAKAMDEKVDELESKLREMHSHEIPEFIRVKIDGVNKDYEKWCGTVG